MSENKKELLKNIDVILSLDANCEYKLNICQLFYGDVTFLQKEYTQKINKWLLKSFKEYYTQFTNAEEISQKIRIFNQFTQQFYLPQLLTTLSRSKCELFEKLMLEELEKAQLHNNLLISTYKIHSGFINIEDYLLPDQYIINNH